MSFTETKHALRIEPLDTVAASPEYLDAVEKHNHASKNLLALLGRNPYLGSLFMETFIAEGAAFVDLLREGNEEAGVDKEKELYELVAGEGVSKQEFFDFNSLFLTFKNTAVEYIARENELAGK